MQKLVHGLRAVKHAVAAERVFPEKIRGFKLVIVVAAGDLRVVVHTGAVQTLEILRGHIVVGVHKAEIFAAGGSHAVVAGGGNAAVLLIDDAQEGILALHAAQKGKAPVRGAVVHRDYLEIPEGLPGQRAQAFREIPFRVVNRNNQANHRSLI